VVLNIQTFFVAAVTITLCIINSSVHVTSVFVSAGLTSRASAKKIIQLQLQARLNAIKHLCASSTFVF
jgi:site-specific recombinase